MMSNEEQYRFVQIDTMSCDSRQFSSFYNGASFWGKTEKITINNKVFYHYTKN